MYVLNAVVILRLATFDDEISGFNFLQQHFLKISKYRIFSVSTPPRRKKTEAVKTDHRILNFQLCQCFRDINFFVILMI